MRVLHVVASINRDVGGPALTVTRLASALAKLDVRTTVASLDYAVHGPQVEPRAVRVESVEAGLAARRLRGWSPRFERTLDALAQGGADLVHNHGLWMFPNLYARRTASRHRLPLVVSPRGMLEAWALRRSQLSKALAWRLFERDNLATAQLFHATSDAEAKAVRAAGLAQPVAVIPNGVDLPDQGKTPGRDVLEAEFPGLRGLRWVLFLSRLHPKKGVDGLLRVWRDLERRHADCHLVLAGPDLDGHGKALRGLAAQLGLAHRVTFTGPLAGAAKASALVHADLLVLPTHSENFGVVVAEALAHGTPALTTHAAPWADLETARCGWWVEDSDAALHDAVDAALVLPRAERQAMGARGRVLVAERYSWQRVGLEMRATYAWVLGAGPRPAFVS